jgi:hypothetical protein
MDDKQYAKSALILALMAFVLSTFPITIPLLAMLLAMVFNVSLKGYLNGYLKFVYALPIAFGWIPGLIIAIFAYRMGQRMKGSLLLINTTRIATVLAIIGTLCFGIFEILAMLINHFAPRGY